MGNKTAIIIGAAPELDITYVKRLADKCPQAFIVCADGGAAAAVRAGLRPDLFIGDGDSLPNGIGMPECEKVILPVEKDDTDIEACALEAVSRGYDELFIVCASGGRADHYLANIFLLERIASFGVSAYLMDAVNKLQFVKDGDMEFKFPYEYKYFSLIPLDDKVENVVLTGFKYPLDGAVVRRTSSLAVSNEPSGKMQRVSFSGRALIVFSKDSEGIS